MSSRSHFPFFFFDASISCHRIDPVCQGSLVRSFNSNPVVVHD
jgi:hypothetical protein